MEKAPADEVFAGSINGDGALEVAVTHLAEDNTLSRIIRMVEEAQERKAPAERFVDQFARWYTPAEALKMATADNSRLLALSGRRSPYPGKLGVVEEGALADLILVDGDPLQDIDLVADPGRNFLVIMKDGDIYKNTVARPLETTP